MKKNGWLAICYEPGSKEYATILYNDLKEENENLRLVCEDGWWYVTDPFDKTQED